MVLGAEEAEMVNNCLVDMAFPFVVMKIFGSRGWLQNNASALDASELFPLKWLILWYVNFTPPKIVITFKNSMWQHHREG